MEFLWKCSLPQIPGGFVSEVDGYHVFLTPKVDAELLIWMWSIQSGGGETYRSDAKVKEHSNGKSMSVEQAEAGIAESLDALGSAWLWR